MKRMSIHRFNVETPTPDDPTLAMLWIGGPLKPSSTPGHVWLTTPYGKELMEVAQAKVHPVTEAEAVQIVVEEAKLQRAKRQ
jgi:hypothetical protein